MKITNSKSPYLTSTMQKKRTKRTARFKYSLARTEPGAHYEGEIVDSKRHGIGFCRWKDNSSYIGDWAFGVRHGNGVFKTDGDNAMTYEGGWVNDIRHGKGRLTLANGDLTIGTWENDCLDGVAKFKKANEKDFEEVLFRNDI